MKTNSDYATNHPAGSPHKTRCKKKRDLTSAATLRPAEVFELYGIPSSTLCELCKHPDPERRMPSMLVPGRCGRKGLRLINHAQLKAWMAKWDTAATHKLAANIPSLAAA